MSRSLVRTVLLTLPLYGWCVERNQPCLTPNGENATCVSLPYCDTFLQAILMANDSAIEFAKHSECGYETGPLLCCGSVAYPISSTDPLLSDLLPDRDTCGTQELVHRIINGQLTEVGEFPWMVLLGYKKNSSDEISFKCGGTLINNRYVLTAAHCVILNPEQELILDIVRLGEWKISTERDCSQPEYITPCADPVLDLKIEKAIAFPTYSRKTGNHDIGLIRLEKNVNYTDYIKPICLPPFYSTPPKPGTLLVVSGWGNTENGTTSDTKLKLEVPIVSNSDCAAVIKNRGLVTDNQICAGGEKAKDACQGDSGGPLMMLTIDKKKYEMQWYQEGVVAWGVGCGHPGIPGIYTRVAAYMGWILNNMSEF